MLKENFRALIVLALSLCLLSGQANAQAQIRVLSTFQSGADPTEMLAQVNAIQTVINMSGGSSYVQIDLVNGGVPMLLTGSTWGGNAEVMYNNTDIGTNVLSLRNQHAADLAVVFVPAIPNACGAAGAYHWVPNGDLIPATGPDHRGKEDAYILLISTEDNCTDAQPYLTAHEFGHAMGMAHDVTLLSGGPGINSNARADYLDSTASRAGEYTVVASNPRGYGPAGVSNCDVLENCDALPQFSNSSTDSPSPYGNGLNNTNVLPVTNDSVATYRNPVPSCGLSVPAPVWGDDGEPCAPEPWTKHLVEWDDYCPEVTQSFQIWAQQPANYWSSFGYTYRWTIAAPQEWDYVFVTGADAYLKLKACADGFCTTLPAFNPKYFARWENECY